MKLQELFTSKRRANNVKATSFKATASEGLSLYAVICYFLQAMVLPAGLCVMQCQTYIALTDVIDCLQAMQYGRVTSETMLRAIERFLDRFHHTWGMVWSTPKFHWLLHFPDHYKNFGTIVACWPLERKHKTPKRYATDVRNTTAYERSFLHEVTCDNLAALASPDLYASMRTGLFKAKPATSKMRNHACDVLGLPKHSVFDCSFSSKCRCSQAVVCQIGDVVLVECGSMSCRAGKISSFLMIEQESVAIMTLWTLIQTVHGTANWRLDNKQHIVFMDAIKDVLIWTEYTDGVVKTLLPAWCRD